MGRNLADLPFVYGGLSLQPGEDATGTLPQSGTPMPIEVQEDEEFRPWAVSLEGKTLKVVSIDERVEEEAEWWESEPVFRMHYQVTLEDGRQLTIFRNMKTGGWYRQAT